jgi:UDPglucose 6-dehydrogenase
MFNTVSGKNICIWGFAFKKDTNDARESPAITVCCRLLEEQAKLKIYDPQVNSETILAALGMEKEDNRITFCESAIEAASGTHAIALLTEWEEFRDADYELIYSKMEKPAHFFDGRNLVDSEKVTNAGFTLSRIGKV